jgi:hypothetical protein
MKNETILETFVWLSSSDLQAIKEAYKNGSYKRKEEKGDQRRLAKSERREEEGVSLCRRNMDMCVLPKQNLDLGRVCNCSYPAKGKETRPKTGKGQSIPVSCEV